MRARLPCQRPTERTRRRRPATPRGRSCAPPARPRSRRTPDSRVLPTRQELLAERLGAPLWGTALRILRNREIRHPCLLRYVRGRHCCCSSPGFHDCLCSQSVAFLPRVSYGLCRRFRQASIPMAQVGPAIGVNIDNSTPERNTSQSPVKQPAQQEKSVLSSWRFAAVGNQCCENSKNPAKKEK